MTWNLENLFRPTAGAGQQAYDRKISDLAAVITSASPDLLGVQEVGDPAAFDDLLTTLGGGWAGLLSQRPDQRGIRVGWATQHGPGALTDPVELADFPTKLRPVQVGDDGTTITAMKRGALAVTCTPPSGVSVRAVTAHLKSKLLTFPGGRFSTRDEDERARYGVYALDERAAEAATVRAWATDALGGHGQDHAVIVCGDLNDTPDAATTQLLLGPPGSQLGTGGFDRPDQGDGARLWNLAPAMPAGNDYSRITDGRRELIDHILVSHQLVHHLEQAGTVPLVGLPTVSANPASLRGAAAPSDHRPVLASFAL
jgi:endonuclease/exonuclease/phosphatase family metal-dependent hydrolase